MADEVIPAAVPAPIVPAPAATPAAVVTPPAEVTPAAAPEASTLLGKDPKAPVAEVKTPEQIAADKAEALKNETPEAKAIREKAEADDVAAGKTVPEKYTVKAPEGMSVNQEILDKLTPVLKEQNITQAGFQKIIDVYAPYIQEQTKIQIAQQQTEAINGFKQQVKDWGVETSKMLGAEPEKALAPAARAIDKLSTDPKAFRAFMENTGVGNNKLFVEFAIAAGKLLGEDTFVDPGTAQAPAGGIDAKVMFPSMAA